VEAVGTTAKIGAWKNEHVIRRRPRFHNDVIGPIIDRDDLTIDRTRILRADVGLIVLFVITFAVNGLARYVVGRGGRRLDAA